MCVGGGGGGRRGICNVNGRKGVYLHITTIRQIILESFGRGGGGGVEVFAM